MSGRVYIQSDCSAFYKLFLSNMTIFIIIIIYFHKHYLIFILCLNADIHQSWCLFLVAYLVKVIGCNWVTKLAESHSHFIARRPKAALSYGSYRLFMSCLLLIFSVIGVLFVILRLAQLPPTWKWLFFLPPLLM